MVLTKEFLLDVNSCLAGYRYALQNNLLNMDYDAVIQFCNTNNQPDFAIWLTQQKSTVAYVKANGSKYIMGEYQVFNPLTGQYTAYSDEASAKAALIIIAKEVLKSQNLVVNQSITNENGDTAWAVLNMADTLTIA